MAVYSELDRDALHVRRADEAYLLGPGPAAESYLNISKIIEVVNQLRCRGGSPRLRVPRRERRLAHALQDNGTVFIGPPPSAIEAMGSKTRARELDAGGGRADRPGHDRAGGDDR